MNSSKKMTNSKKTMGKMKKNKNPLPKPLQNPKKNPKHKAKASHSASKADTQEDTREDIREESLSTNKAENRGRTRTKVVIGRATAETKAGSKAESPGRTKTNVATTKAENLSTREASHSKNTDVITTLFECISCNAMDIIVGTLEYHNLVGTLKLSKNWLSPLK